MVTMRRPLILEFRLLFYAILGVVVPFGVLLYFIPGGTDVYWAWSIPEARSAMLIGAAYLGATVYYLAALLLDDWQMVENGLGGLILFSLVLLAATMVHWNAFKPFHPVTLVWLAFYYGGPFLIPFFRRRQLERQDPQTDEGGGLAAGVRAWLVGRGVVYAALGVAGFAFADAVVAMWPWPLRPLELRVFIGQLAVVSWGGLVVLRSRRAWRRHSLGALLAAAIALCQLVALVAGPTPYQASAPLGALLPIMFAEWLVVAVVLFILQRRRSQ